MAEENCLLLFMPLFSSLQCHIVLTSWGERWLGGRCSRVWCWGGSVTLASWSLKIWDIHLPRNFVSMMRLPAQFSDCSLRSAETSIHSMHCWWAHFSTMRFKWPRYFQQSRYILLLLLLQMLALCQLNASESNLTASMLEVAEKRLAADSQTGMLNGEWGWARENLTLFQLAFHHWTDGAN